MARKKKKQQPTDREIRELLNGDEEALAVHKTMNDAKRFLTKNGYQEGPICIDNIDFSTVDLKDLRLKVSSPEEAKITLDCVVNLMLNGRLPARNAQVLIQATEASMKSIRAYEQDREIQRLTDLLNTIEEQND